MLAVGLYMVWEALQQAGDGADTEEPASTGFWRLAATAIATSIDAAAVGVSLALMDVNLWIACAIIGGITTIVATGGIILGRHFGPYLGRYAGIFGGFVLVAIGASILYQHLSGAA